MRRFRSLPSLAVLFLCPLAFAQSTWIVDVNNGPGTNFTSLQVAIFSSSPGDLLLVRAGNYQPSIVDRPLTIVGEANATVTGNGGYSPGFVIAPLPAGTFVAIEGITFAATALVNESLRVSSGPGRVILDRVRSAEMTNIMLADDVRMSRCQFDKGLSVWSSACTLDRCQVHANPLSLTGTAALSLTNAFVHLDRCQVSGSNAHVIGIQTYPATAAIDATGSAVVLSGDGSGAISAGTGASVPAVQGTGSSLEIDPHVVLQPSGSAPAVAGVAVVTKSRPSLAVDAGPPGGTVDIDLFGPVGSGYAAAVGVAVPPTPVVVWSGHLWLDPLLFWGVGAFGITGRVLGQIPLPNVPGITGLTYSWQAVSFDATSGIVLSNSVTYVHPK